MGLLRVETSVTLQTPQMYEGSGSRWAQKTPALACQSRIGEKEKAGKNASTSDVNAMVTLISYDRDSGRVVVKILDTIASRIVRQIPSEDLVVFLRKFRNAVPLAIDITV